MTGRNVEGSPDRSAHALPLIDTGRSLASDHSKSPAKLGPALPPPPFRMHSYHHDLSSSSSDYSDATERSRHHPQRWEQERSPILDSRATTQAAPPRLPSRSYSSNFGSFQLPPLSATFGAPSAWRSPDEAQRGPASPGSRGYGPADAGQGPSQMFSSRSGDRMLPPLSPGLATSPPSLGAASMDLASHGRQDANQAPRKMAKAHVPSACLNCKRAHLACDVGRPCRRCINLGKSDTCIDVQHKKRGRPRLKDRQASQSSTTQPTSSGEVKASSDRTNSTSPASSSRLRHSPQSEPGYFRSPTERSSMLSPPIPSSDMVQRVAGPTHGPGVQTRTPSVSVSASSYPASRPDHLHQYADGIKHSPLGSGSKARAYETPASAVVTIICSTSLQCARVSEECTALLGYHPSDVLERSLFELVHPTEAGRLEELWTSLIDPIGVVPQAVPASADVVMTIPPARLMAPASGTIFVQENMRLRQRNGMYDFYSIRLHLGAGFGVDLYRRETLNRAYIVASLLKLGNDATHPDPSVLRFPYQGSQSSGNQEFWTPSGAPPPSSPPVNGGLASTAPVEPTSPYRTGRFTGNGLAVSLEPRNHTRAAPDKVAPPESHRLPPFRMERGLFDKESSPKFVSHSHSRNELENGRTSPEAKSILPSKRSSSEITSSFDDSKSARMRQESSGSSHAAPDRDTATDSTVDKVTTHRISSSTSKTTTAPIALAARSPTITFRSALSSGSRTTSHDGIAC